MNVVVTHVVRDEGSIVVFGAGSPDGDRTFHVACDHRMAQDIVDALPAGPVEVDIEGWQIMGGG